MKGLSSLAIIPFTEASSFPAEIPAKGCLA